MLMKFPGNDQILFSYDSERFRNVVYFLYHYLYIMINLTCLLSIIVLL